MLQIIFKRFESLKTRKDLVKILTDLTLVSTWSPVPRSNEGGEGDL